MTENDWVVIIMGLSGIGLAVLCWITRVVCFAEGWHKKSSPLFILAMIAIVQTINLCSFACWLLDKFLWS